MHINHREIKYFLEIVSSIRDLVLDLVPSNMGNFTPTYKVTAIMPTQTSSQNHSV